MKHDGTPWSIEGPDQFGDYNIHGQEKRLAVGAVVSNMRPPIVTKANADLIVTAVNAFHNYEGDLSKVEAGGFGRLVEALHYVMPRYVAALGSLGIDPDHEWTLREHQQVLTRLSRLTEGGGDG